MGESASSHSATKEGGEPIRATAATPWPPAPPWGSATKLWVVTVVLVAVALLWWSVRELTTIAALGALLAYILNPVIVWIRKRFGIGRGWSAVAVYATVAVLIALLAGLLAQKAARSIATVSPLEVVPRITKAALEVLPQEIAFRDQTWVMAPYYAEAQHELAEAMRTSGDVLLGGNAIAQLLGHATDYATGFVWSAVGLLAVFFVSLYLAIDGDKVLDWCEAKVPTTYRPSYHALRKEIDIVWRRFFRGQLVLAFAVGVLTTGGLILLGISYAIPLGIIAGVLEVIPRLGPALSVLPAAVVAAIYPSSTLPGLSGLWLVILVLVLYIAIQNLENTVLVPRIVGGSVNLPPAVMLLGAIAGAKLAGIPGILLAAPVMGSVRVIGSWTYDQLTSPADEPATGRLEAVAAPPKEVRAEPEDEPESDAAVTLDEGPSFE